VKVNVCSPQELLQIILHEVFITKEFFEADFPLTCSQTEFLDEILPKVLASKNLFKTTPMQNGLSYQSAIAYKLAAHLQTSPEIIASYLVKQVSRYTFKPSQTSVNLRVLPQSLSNLHSKASSGYVQIQFSDRAIAQWLSAILNPAFLESCCFSSNKTHFPSCKLLNSDPYNNAFFPIQHAHARCCSLLRQVEPTGILKQENTKEASRTDWQWLKPELIDWLNEEHRPRISHQSELELIFQIFVVLDTLWWESTQCDTISSSQILPSVIKLADRFQRMHQAIQIWGLLGSQDLELKARPSQECYPVHLALIAVTQRLLNWSLCQKMGVAPLFEL
jgi:hypothetical protein